MIADGAVLDTKLHGTKTDPRTYLLRFYPRSPVPPLDRVAENVVPLVAEVHHGLWIARCSCRARVTARRPDHPGGVVWLDLPLVWCPRCKNKAAGGAWRRVVLPADREAIDAVLSLRPDPETRNWSIPETVADLERENVEHDISLPGEEV